MISNTNLIGHVNIHLQTGNNTIKTALYSILVWTETSAAVSIMYLDHRLYKQRKHLIVSLLNCTTLKQKEQEGLYCKTLLFIWLTFSTS